MFNRYDDYGFYYGSVDNNEVNILCPISHYEGRPLDNYKQNNCWQLFINGKKIGDFSTKDAAIIAAGVSL